MGRRLTRSATGARTAVAHDIHWAGERRTAIGVTCLLYAALLGMDAAFGTLDTTRGTLWTGLAVLAFVILLPLRVSTVPGVLSARGLLTGNTVRTDSLASISWSDDVAQRMVLRDTEGNAVEVDPTVLVRNPAMWRRFDEDTRTSTRRGTLLCGAVTLRELAARIDRETARTVFQVSGL
ncbi:hypothetical protein [Streptomyces goshikiensis]|uniref:hypothetical protein n=1 Tax=Streptomyces goshikiensis TaxID=1942 RepID=UPI0037226C6B